MSADNSTSLGFTNPSNLVNCTVDTCSIYTSFYNYRIDLVPNAVFLALFGLAIPFFYGVFFYTRRGFWFMTAMQFGLASEVIGYVGRILSYNNQWDLNGFLINNICLTLGPAFFSASLYLCLGIIIRVYGPQNSRIRPDLFTKIFIPCDIVAIILQGAGGGIAAADLGTNSSLSVGDDVIIAGLSSQVGTLFIFTCLGADFALTVRRRRKQLGDEVALTQEPLLVAIRGSKMFYFFPYALGLSTMLIFWRCCYRVAELNQGFTGLVTYNQPLFIGFEGVLMVLTVAALAIFHPAFCLGEAMQSGKILGFRGGNGIASPDEVKETPAANGARGTQDIELLERASSDRQE